jgi:hypothetical protein
MTGAKVGAMTGAKVGGATGLKVGGATGVKTGGETGANDGGTTGANVGGATGVKTGGVTGVNVGGTTGANDGGTTGAKEGGGVDGGRANGTFMEPTPLPATPAAPPGVLPSLSGPGVSLSFASGWRARLNLVKPRTREISAATKGRKKANATTRIIMLMVLDTTKSAAFCDCQCKGLSETAQIHAGVGTIA